MSAGTPQSPDRSRPGPRAGGWLEPSRLFLALAATFGLAILAANPPFQAPDEWEHFCRAMQLADGHLVGTKQNGSAGGVLPVHVQIALAAITLPFHPENKMSAAIFARMRAPAWVDWRLAPRAYYAFPHIVLYSPAGYLPQVAAISAGKAARVGPLGLLYLARLADLAACAGIGWLALRAAPAFRWSLALVLLAPMSLYLMGSVAADGILIAGAALLASLAARLASEPGRLPSGREQAGILLLAALLPLAKFVYFPLALAAAALAAWRLGAGRSRLRFALLYLATGVVPVWFWARVIAALYTPGRTDISTNPVAQGHFIAFHPFIFLGLALRSIAGEAGGTYHMMVGVLGWVDTVLPGWFYPAYGIALALLVALESGEAARLRGGFRGLMLAVAAATLLLIYAAIYAHWNPPHSRQPIEGVQGRYLLPLVPFLLYGTPPLGQRLFFPRVTAWLGAAAGVASAAVCLWAVIARYYLP